MRVEGRKGKDSRSFLDFRWHGKADRGTTLRVLSKEEHSHKFCVNQAKDV